jgi:hypothetical protein
MKDRALLDRMMREAGCPPNIHVTNFNRGKVGWCRLTPDCRVTEYPMSILSCSISIQSC